MKLHLDGQISASEASRLQIGAANCNQRGAAQSNVSPLTVLLTLLFKKNAQADELLKKTEKLKRKIRSNQSREPVQGRGLVQDRRQF